MCEPRFELKVLVDPFGTGVFVELESAGTFEIVSGPAAALKFILPTDVRVAEPFRASLKFEDEWGNPAVSNGSVQISGTDCFEGIPSTHVFSEEHVGIFHVEGVRVTKEGTYWLEAHAPDCELQATSNVITVHQAAPPIRRFWGDLHGQSEETVGTKRVDEYFAFAREQALVDFAGHQENCFQITKEIWERIRETNKAYHEPGRFVTFLGYEWSGLSSGGCA